MRGHVESDAKLLIDRLNR